MSRSDTKRESLRRAIVMVAVTWFLAAAAGAQSPPSDSLLPVGSRVRVRPEVTSDSVVIGRLEALRGDTLLIRSERTLEPLTIAARDVGRLEVYRRGRIAETTGIIAGTIGAVAGGVAYTRWCRGSPTDCRDDRERSDSTNPRYDHSPSALTVLVVGGTAIGALTGYFLAPPQWEVWGRPVQLNLAPTGRGLALGVSIGAQRVTRRVDHHQDVLRP